MDPSAVVPRGVVVGCQFADIHSMPGMFVLHLVALGIGRLTDCRKVGLIKVRGD